MWSSEEEYTSVSSEEESEFSWNPSDESFISESEDFLPYDENLEPSTRRNLPKRSEKSRCSSADSQEKSGIGV